MKMPTYLVIFSISTLLLFSCYQEESNIDELEDSTVNKTSLTSVNKDFDITFNASCSPFTRSDENSLESFGTFLYNSRIKSLANEQGDCNISIVNRQDKDDNIDKNDLLFRVSNYLEYFNEHLLTKFQNTDVLIYRIELGLYESAEVVWFKYESVSTGEIGSVMYGTNQVSNTKALVHTIEIECTGTCENTCREKYNIPNSRYDCTCQESTCKGKLITKN